MLAAHDGIWTSRALFELKLLDSFMKESQRLSPGSLCKPLDRTYTFRGGLDLVLMLLGPAARFTRYVEKPLTLSDGTRLQAGDLIESPAAAILLDPGLYENPEVSFCCCQRTPGPPLICHGRRSMLI